jgi:benzoyl-CoA reductase/2-hydroxyglutaryl-CoA dehydratase subunit BcrC/BadD/HgdB
MTKVLAKDAVKTLQAEYYAEALRAKEEGKLVAWVTSIAPREFLEAMDIITIYPENHAAAIAAKKGSMEMMEIAESMGYSTDICSYARTNLGYVEAGDCVAGKLPVPDLLVCCNNICNTVTKWYEILSRRLNVPLLMIDMPFSHDDEVDEHAVDFMVGQFKHLISQLEEITGKPFNYERFHESMELSNKASLLWKECADFGRNHPCPFNGIDFFNYMALIVCMRGNEKAVEFFTLLRDELAEKAARGEGYLENEKYRILWDGIPFWFNLKAMMRSLKNYGACMVGSTYPDNWVLPYDTHDLRSLAKAYTSIFINRNFDYRVKNMTRLIKELDIDGVIFHSNRSCKAQDFAQYAMSRKITEVTGVPTVVVDGDQNDPRAFSEAQYETRVQALYEIIDQRRAAAASGGK